MPGNYSTQGPVINAILSLIANQNLTYGQPLAQTPTAVPIFDGAPGAAGVPDVFISIAGEDPNVTHGNEEWSWLGTASRYELYTILGHAYAYCGGDDNLAQFQAAGGNAQQTARNQATLLMQGVETALLADPTLQTVNGGQPLVIWAYVVDVVLEQPTQDDPGLATGRWAKYDFIIQVKNTLTGPGFYGS